VPNRSELVAAGKWSLGVMAYRIGWNELSLAGPGRPVITDAELGGAAFGGGLGLVRSQVAVKSSSMISATVVITGRSSRR
jgi:hypothetical protein